MNFEVTLQSTDNWVGGGNGSITIKNVGAAVSTWQFQLSTVGFTITSFWNLTLGGSGNNITVSPPTWQLSLAAGQSTQSGFAYTGTFGNSTSSTAGVKIINSTSTTSTTTTPVTTTPVAPVVTSTPSSFPALTSSKKVFGYFSEWNIYQRAYQVENIPVKQLTHIVYAFMLPNPSQADYNLLASKMSFPPKPFNAPPAVAEGALVSQDAYANGINVPKLNSLKAQNPNVKILVSIGGWTMSWTLSKIAADPTLRATLVKTTTDFILKNGWDGADLDWEFPAKQGAGYNYVDATNDPINLIALLKAFRTEFDTRSPSKHLEITAAMGCNQDVIKNYAGTAPYLDWINLMTYDFAGSWAGGGHQSGLYYNPASGMDPQWNCDSAVKNTLAIGFPASKICLGIPLYARGWAKIQPNNTTNPIFGASLSGAATSYSGAAGEPGLTSWKDLRDKIGTNGLTRYYDSVAHACYVFNSSTGEAWTYDDPDTVTEKAKYVINNNLGGVLFWEISDDSRDGLKNLINTVVTTLNSGTTTTTPVAPVTTTPVTTTPVTTTPVTTTPVTTTPVTTTPVVSTNVPVTPTSGLSITIKNNGSTDYVIKAGQSVVFNI